MKRNIAFGFSTICNLKCKHCVATGRAESVKTMELSLAKKVIQELADANVTGISFTAGEPFLLFDDLLELISNCSEH